MSNGADNITIIVDTREKNPLDLSKHGIDTVVGTLKYGDYSMKYPSLQQHVAVERKSLDDFLMCCGRERERFEKELTGLRGIKYSMILCEFRYEEIFSDMSRSRINRNAVAMSIARWQMQGHNIQFSGNREMSTVCLVSYFKVIAKDIYSFAKQCVEV